MRGIAIILFILSICGIVKTIDLKRSHALKESELTNTIKSKNKELTSISERLTVYYLITLEQNKGLEKYKSTRDWKENNKELNLLMQRL